MKKILLGIDRQDEIFKITKGKRVALLTNFSGIDSNNIPNYRTLLQNGCNLIKLMTPEHGLYGAADGEGVSNSIHRETGLPIISLYGDKKEPSKNDLEDVDLIIYDIQDVGLRYFTYIYTLANIINACSKYDKALIVADRPNPLGCEFIFGSRIPEKHNSFVGGYHLPIRYGMTVGEIGHYFIKLCGHSIRYYVITMQGYSRDLRFPQLNIHWNVPSPNLPDYDALQSYCGGCFFEATNISEGRGTPRPFRFYGAPYIKEDQLAKELSKIFIDGCGFTFRERSFTPYCSKHSGEICHGVEIIPQDDTKNFIPLSIEMLQIIKKLYPEDFSYNEYADVGMLSFLTGDERITQYVNGEIESLDEMYVDWDIQRECFMQRTREFYLYN